MLEYMREDAFTAGCNLASGLVHSHTAQTAFLRSEYVLFSAGPSASPLKVVCTAEEIRLQCFMKYFSEEMKVNWYRK